jgi:hypothetical protein
MPFRKGQFAHEAVSHPPTADATLRSEMDTLPSGVEIDGKTNAPTSSPLINIDRPKQITRFIQSVLDRQPAHACNGE